jgi:hypothetical protein
MKSLFDFELQAYFKRFIAGPLTVVGNSAPSCASCNAMLVDPEDDEHHSHQRRRFHFAAGKMANRILAGVWRYR